MAVIHLPARLSEITHALLTELAEPDEDIIYSVHMEDYYTECEHGDATAESGVGFYLQIPVSDKDDQIVTARSAWVVPTGRALDHEKWIAMVRDTWEKLVFERIAFEGGLIGGDLEATMNELDKGDPPT